MRKQIAYKSSRRYGAESNDACKATLTEGLARTRPVSPVATIAYSRHEATSDLVDTISHAENVSCINQRVNCLHTKDGRSYLLATL